MKFIKVTKKSDNFSVWINQYMIVSVINKDPVQETGALLRMRDGSEYETVENANTVLAMIAS